MTPIVIWYHCLFSLGSEPLWSAVKIVHEQMHILRYSGLEHAATEIHCGVNGTEKESGIYAQQHLPKKAQIHYHGLQCRNENRTLLMMQEWCRSHKGEAHILYFHSKGATHPLDSYYAENKCTPWRHCMMMNCVDKWPVCVKHLEAYEACGCAWYQKMGSDHSQNYFAGNFYWVRASFFRTIPSLMTRHRIKVSGLDALESRFEAEVHIGNGPRLPRVKDYTPGWTPHI